MRAITRDEIEKAWDELCEIDEEETQALIERFMEGQPALGMYVSVGFESLEENPDSLLIDIILACWQAMGAAATTGLQQVTAEEIEQAEEMNSQAMQKLEGAAESEWETAVGNLLNNYNQRELLGFGVEVLMSVNGEEPEMLPESVGLELLWFKTALDCLDKTP